MRLYQNQPSGTVAALRALRRNPTDAEKELLRALRISFPDHKWRFQAPVGPFRVDFLCFDERLVIEVDGGQHAEAAAYDERRTRFIARAGYRLLRFWNNDVLGNTDGVIATVAKSLTSLSHREREGAHRVSDGKGEGEQKRRGARAIRSPSPLPPPSAAGPSPLPMGEGFKGEER